MPSGYLAFSTTLTDVTGTATRMFAELIETARKEKS